MLVVEGDTVDEEIDEFIDTVDESAWVAELEEDGGRAAEGVKVELAVGTEVVTVGFCVEDEV